MKIHVERWKYLEGDTVKEQQLDQSILEKSNKILGPIAFFVVPIVVTDEKGNGRWVSAIYTFLTYKD